MKKETAATEKAGELNFEEAFARLEQILEQLNSETVSLDQSLKLYEEADKLITSCGKKLNDAERKIEMIIKNRNGELVLGQDQKPTVQNFNLHGSNTQQG